MRWRDGVHDAHPSLRAVPHRPCRRAADGRGPDNGRMARRLRAVARPPNPIFLRQKQRLRRQRHQPPGAMAAPMRASRWSSTPTSNARSAAPTSQCSSAGSTRTRT
ncbi:hypothetical protein J4732_17315 [Serratia marcescens]|uniref:Uncharacterized protein n=1 Tax=Serratia marcescens TaxID=615 RepID=A0A939NPG9_SERMA|nr:hypothetical protein [Serratia marcescens]